MVILAFCYGMQVAIAGYLTTPFTPFIQFDNLLHVYLIFASGYTISFISEVISEMYMDSFSSLKATPLILLSLLMCLSGQLTLLKYTLLRHYCTFILVAFAFSLGQNALEKQVNALTGKSVPLKNAQLNSYSTCFQFP